MQNEPRNIYELVQRLDICGCQEWDASNDIEENKQDAIRDIFDFALMQGWVKPSEYAFQTQPIKPRPGQ